MPRLPAFCEECGAVFASPLQAAAAGKENAFGIPVPCRACDGSGRVPGELLEICVEAARLFADPGETGDEAFLELLASPPGEGDAPGEELLARAARTAPAFVDVARRLPADRPRVVEGTGRLLRRIREEVGPVGGDTEAGPGGDDERDPPAPEPASGRLEDAVLRAVEAFLEDEGVERAAPDVPEDVREARRRLDGTGRNDPCPCGSGDKYKDCHWAPDLRTTRS